jgi:S-adenosylmethionine:diacylglycerol 3-amino-3-carboxypropyl transferase
MLPTPEMASTPWRHGPFKAQSHQLSFGQTYEDSGIELQTFKPRSRVFCIAGAGCTARALAAAGHHVTAVDINPLQLDYAQLRAAGGPLRIGVAERLLAFGRNLAKLAGWSRVKLADFLNLSDPGEQVEYWDRRLDTQAWRVAVDTLLSPRVLGICYASPFIESLPQDFGLRLRQRLRRTWATHSNRSNPYAASLLLGRPPIEPNAPEFLIQFVCADAADFLESSPPAAFDGFSLSNIGDGASPEYLWRLRVAIDHAAAPNAIVVARTFAEPGPNTLANRAPLDRSLLWGVVEVSRTAEICAGGKSCCTC